MRVIIYSILVVILLTGFASAEILLSSPNAVYNKGDVINIDATITSAGKVDGFFQLYLICAGEEKEFYREYIVLNSGEEKKATAQILVKDNSVGAVLGICKIKGKFNEAYVLTPEFSVSDKISDASVALEKDNFNPEESIVVRGKASKENGLPVNGFFEMTASNSTLTVSGPVLYGDFIFNFSFPKNARAGAYDLNFKIYEKDSSEKVTNQGFASVAVNINQIPSKIEIAMENDEVVPGSTLQFTPTLFDQAGDEVKAQGVFTIKDTKGKIIDQLKGNSGELQEFTPKNNALAGQWKIFAVAYKISTEKTFKVLENPEVTLELQGNKLIVKNIGNVPYTKTLIVDIGDETVNIPANVNIGQTKEYDLLKYGKNQTGVQLVKINDGDKEIEGQLAFASPITGAAVAPTVNSTGGLISGKNGQSPLLWMLLVLIFGIFGLLLFRGGKKTKYVENNRFMVGTPVKIKRKEKIDEVKNTPAKFSIPKSKDSALDLTTGDLKKAEHMPTISGNPQESIIVCMKIKNGQEVRQNLSGVKDSFEEINVLAGRTRAVLHETPDFRFYMFVPTVTKTIKNGRTALTLAKEISNILKRHNKFFKQKVEFGISVNLGEIVLQTEQGKIYFNSPGDALNSSKKIAEISNGEPLISEKLRARIMSDVKTEKVENSLGVNVYRVIEILNRTMQSQTPVNPPKTTQPQNTFNQNRTPVIPGRNNAPEKKTESKSEFKPIPKSNPYASSQNKNPNYSNKISAADQYREKVNAEQNKNSLISHKASEMSPNEKFINDFTKRNPQNPAYQKKWTVD